MYVVILDADTSVQCISPLAKFAIEATVSYIAYVPTWQLFSIFLRILKGDILMHTLSHTHHTHTHTYTAVAGQQAHCVWAGHTWHGGLPEDQWSESTPQDRQTLRRHQNHECHSEIVSVVTFAFCLPVTCISLWQQRLFCTQQFSSQVSIVHPCTEASSVCDIMFLYCAYACTTLVPGSEAHVHTWIRWRTDLQRDAAFKIHVNQLYE